MSVVLPHSKFLKLLLQTPCESGIIKSYSQTLRALIGSYAAFTPAHHATCCGQQASSCAQLVARNLLRWCKRGITHPWFARRSSSTCLPSCYNKASLC